MAECLAPGLEFGSLKIGDTMGDDLIDDGTALDGEGLFQKTHRDVRLQYPSYASRGR